MEFVDAEVRVHQSATGLHALVLLFTKSSPKK